MPGLNVLNFLTILGSNVLKIVLILRVIFCKYLRLNMLYIVSKTFYGANFKNKATTVSAYGHNSALKFHRSELENFCYVYKLFRFVLFCCS